MRRVVICTVLLVLALSGVQAFADLDGANVTVNYIYPDINTVYQVLGTGTVTGSGFTVNSFGQHDFTTFPTDRHPDECRRLRCHIYRREFQWLSVGGQFRR